MPKARGGGPEELPRPEAAPKARGGSQEEQPEERGLREHRRA